MTQTPENPPAAAAGSIPLLDIAFGGLCSFVVDDDCVHTLLVDAEQSSVRPRLCRHSAVLLFRGEDLRGLRGAAVHTTFTDPDGSVLCAFDLAGCMVEIRPGGRGLNRDNPHSIPTIDLDDSFLANVLDLRTHSGLVDRHWLDAPLHHEGLVGSRFHLTHGLLASTQLTDRPWGLALPGQQPPRSGRHLGQIVDYTLRGSSAPRFMELRITNARSGGVHTLRFRPGARLAASILCPFERADVRDERDVFAVYDLEVEPRSMADRRRPVRVDGDVLPGQSACPPVIQEAEGEGGP